MKLLFLAMSPAGFGETLMGLSLADQLSPAGVVSHFVIEPGGLPLLRNSGHQYEVLQPGMGALARLIVDDVVATFEPDVIVLADYFTHCGVLTRRYGIDPWFIESYGLPIVPIDIWEWEKTDFVIDLLGNAGYRVDYRVSDHFRELPAHLRPVPLAHLEADGTRSARPYRVWEGGERVSAKTKRHLWETYGLRRSDRVVLLATAAWQNGDDSSYREAVGPVLAGVPELLAHHLAALPDTTHFLLVGEVPPALRALPPERVHTMPSCSPKRFSVLLGSADLVVSLNVGATTVARAVMSEIATMVLTNRFEMRDEQDLEKADADLGGLAPEVRDIAARRLPLYPYRMWPLRFYAFLEPLLTGNPYNQAIEQAEILDRAGVVATMTSLLYDPDARDRHRAGQAAYAAAVRALPDTPQVFAETVARFGLEMRLP